MAEALASLSSLPSRVVGDAAIDRAAYYLALEGVTRFALIEATRSIHQGALKHAWFPNQVEFRMQCDKVMAPYVAARRRMEAQAKQQRENEAYERTRQAAAKAGKDRARKAYADFVAGYEAMKRNEPEGFASSLDPELVAKIPDRPAPRLGPDHGGL